MGNSNGGEVGRAVWLDEMALEDESRPEVVLSVVVGDADARRLTARETLDVGLRALVERDHSGIVVRLHWWISGAKYEHRLDPADRRTVELMRRLAVQPLLPLVVSGRRGTPLQVYDCDNMFRAAESPPDGTDPAETRRPGCRHRWRRPGRS